MIHDWRQKLRQPSLPFYFVLLAGFTGGDNFTELRDGQLAALRLPFTGAASALDLGDEASPQGGVHSRYKAPVGARLARFLLRDVYRLPVIAQGPEVDRRGISVEASEDGGTVSGVMPYGDEEWSRGLYINGTLGCTSCCSNGTGLLSLSVVNSTDRVAYSPVVAVNGSSHLAFRVKLQTPLSAAARILLRFEWYNFPQCLLYNREQLPANPWEVTVAVKRAPSRSVSPVTQYE